MNEVARPSDMGDLLEEFIDRRPVQAVQLDSAKTIMRVGRWINANGWVCSWAAAEGLFAESRATVSNRLVIHQPRDAVTSKPQTAEISDWVVRRRDGEFQVVSDARFHETYDPVFKGQVDVEEHHEP